MLGNDRLMDFLEFRINDWFLPCPLSFVWTPDCSNEVWLSVAFTGIFISDSTYCVAGLALVHQIDQLITGLARDQARFLDVARVFGLQNEMSFMHSVYVRPQESFQVKIEIHEFPVRIGESVDEIERSCIFNSFISSILFKFVISCVDDVSLSPKLQKNNLPRLLQIHPPKRFATLLINGNKIVNNIGLPPAVVINNCVIHSTGLEILSEKQRFIVRLREDSHLM